MVTPQTILPSFESLVQFQPTTANNQENIQHSTKKAPPPPIRPPLIDLTNSARAPPLTGLDVLPTVKPGPYPVSTACLSKKRTHELTHTSDSPTPTGPDAEDGDSETDEDADEELVEELDMDCDVVRAQIRAFLAEGNTAVAFRKLIRATPGSYNGFMKQQGRDAGIAAETYRNAVLFFVKRDRRAKRAAEANLGVSAPPVAPVAPVVAVVSEPAAKRRKQDAPAAKRPVDNSIYDVSDIHLEKEERDAVPVFDTCDDVRTKIRAFFRQPDCTQAALLRKLGVQYIMAPRALRSPQVNTFMRQKGPLEGNSSGIFYAAYVYFEKLRIKQGKKKSAKREEMEKKWGPGGVDRTAGGGTFWCKPGEVPVQDDYGCITFESRGRR
ncbi:hypothetical protein V502_01343 [Pseudogymnoascus sp. VKM F-4520 (FW-2644)]|nr:hypothetical protein V502_01343 [Pseudogymnoascus sp. VKM F-4520 (FW-2644)]